MSDSEERTLEDVSLPDEVEGFTKRRVELVQRAVKEWTGALIDLGGRNNLLRYRDLKAGTLDLTSAEPRAVASLLQSKAIKTSSLFRDPEERERNVRRLRTISNKAKENFEERGLETLSLGCTSTTTFAPTCAPGLPRRYGSPGARTRSRCRRSSASDPRVWRRQARSRGTRGTWSRSRSGTSSLRYTATNIASSGDVLWTRRGELAPCLQQAWPYVEPIEWPSARPIRAFKELAEDDGFDRELTARLAAQGISLQMRPETLR